MNKTLSLLAIVIAATGYSTVSNAESYYYKGGLSVGSPGEHIYAVKPLVMKLDNGSGLHFAIGKDFNKSFSGEIEFSHQSYDFKSSRMPSLPNSSTALDGNLTYSSLMFNTIYRPFLSSSNDYFKPYIGAGIGMSTVSHNKLKVTNAIMSSISASDTVPAGQIFIGNRFELESSLFIDVEYRYFKAKPYKVDHGIYGIEAFKSTAVRSFALSIGKSF